MTISLLDTALFFESRSSIDPCGQLFAHTEPQVGSQFFILNRC